MASKLHTIGNNCYEYLSMGTVSTVTPGNVLGEDFERDGRYIGRTVKVDMTTTDVTRGCFARVCIELDLSKSLIPTVMIIGRVIHVEYEGLPKICFSCGLYGY